MYLFVDQTQPSIQSRTFYDTFDDFANEGDTDFLISLGMLTEFTLLENMGK